MLEWSEMYDGGKPLCAKCRYVVTDERPEWYCRHPEHIERITDYIKGKVLCRLRSCRYANSNGGCDVYEPAEVA